MSDSSKHDIELLSLIEEALELPQSERKPFILDRLANNTSQEVRALALLAKVEQDSDDSVLTGYGLNQLLDMAQPQQLGNYEIIGEIGRGGMGVVYHGKRVGADFDHEAAIKIVSVSEGSQKLVERLRSERRLLAQLKHPNIAQFYDGGETEEGYPYFVMELVDGQPLHKYLQQNTTTIKQRLRLFKQICAAISYAHTNTIVHRDLSPSNVMVSKSGLVKVIDFGISSSLNSPLQGSGATQTIGYTAPERIGGDAATTLCDIYSLGAILSDLMLPDSNPFETELKAIISKAMQTVPHQRYASTDALLSDIVNVLNFRPVKAINGGALYRAKCFIRANKALAIASSALFIGAICSAILFAALYVRATDAEQRAQARFNEVRQLATFLMFEHYENVSDLPGSTQVRAELADKAQAYLEQLNQLDNAPIDLQVETAAGFRRLGDVFGNPVVPNLGFRKKAQNLLENALERLSALEKVAPYSASLMRAKADAHLSLSGFNFIVLDNNEDAIRHGENAERYYRALMESSIYDEYLIEKIAAAKRAQSNALVWVSRGQEAIQAAQDALEFLEPYSKSHANSLVLKKELSNVLTTLGYNSTLHFDNLGSSDYGDAPKTMEAGIALAREVIAEEKGNRRFEALLALNLLRLGTVYYSMDQESIAMTFLNEAKHVVETLLSIDPNDKELVRRMNSILKQSSMTQAYLSNFDDAYALSDEYIRNQQQLIAGEPDNSGYQRELANGYGMRGEVALLQNDIETACIWYLKADQLYKNVIDRFNIDPSSTQTERRFIAEGLKQCESVSIDTKVLR